MLKKCYNKHRGENVNYNNAKKYFEEFINDNYDVNDKKVSRKIKCTYSVVANAKQLCEYMKLDELNTELAMIIALLHDIGRFDQAKIMKSFREDITNFDHASLGVKILFEKGEIVNYVENKKYYPIIEKAIANHSKDILDETGMTDIEILHCKIIRDADKIDSFRNKLTDDIYTIANITKEEVENSKVTEKVYNAFKEHKTIFSKDRQTGLDIWVSYIALIFGLEFKRSYELINEKDYLNKLFNRFDYKVDKATMDELKEYAFDYLNNKLNQ